MATQVTVITGEGSTSYSVSTSARGPTGPEGTITNSSVNTAIATNPSATRTAAGLVIGTDVAAQGDTRIEPQVKSSSFIASNGETYHVVASATVTDPSPVEGKGFSVLVRNGTATVGGTAYSTAGTVIIRTFHSGTWVNHVYRESAYFGTAATANTGDFDAAGSADDVYNALAPGATGNFTLVMEGDSITEGVTSGGATVGNYLQNRLALEGYFSGRASIFNVATSGNTIANVVSQYTSQVYPYRPSANAGKRAVLLLLIGTNDSTTLATQITNAASVLSYCATARADGFEVWLCTLLPRGATVNYWTPFNNALREGESYDKLIDYAALFADTTTWTDDNLHPNNLGYRILASFVNGRAYSRSIRDGFNHGSMGKQDSDSVIITGGTFSGSTGTFTGSVTRTSTSASNAEFVSQALGSGSNRQWLFGHVPNPTGNLPNNSFSMTYYNGTGFESGLAGFSPNGGIVSNQSRLVARTVANLSLLSATIGNKALVNDALLPVISATVAGSGAKLCEVVYNGSNWIVTSILN